MQKSILILAYYSFKDPVFQSAVLPYFIDFPDKEKYKFILLTFEQKRFSMSRDEMTDTKSRLLKSNIIWYQTVWNSGKLKAFKKIIDLVWGSLISFRLMYQHKSTAIYSEGFPGAILGYYIARLSGRKHLIHTFEPHADYMVEAGIWSERSWETRLLRKHEKLIARHAFYIFTATSGMIRRIKGWGVSPQVPYRVPSCVDLKRFSFDRDKRNRIRAEYLIGDHEIVIAYLGKFGGMYMEEEVFEFFRLFSSRVCARFFILTQDDTKKITSWIAKYSLEDKVIMTALERDEIPGYLSASDFGFVAVRPKPSKAYCSPIKTGEYLACGLPVIVPVGISDDYDELHENGLAILMESVGEDAFSKVTEQAERWINTRDAQAVRERARQYVNEDRNIEKFKALYAALFGRL